MDAVFVVAVIVMVAVFVVALIALGRLSAKWATEQPNFEASLAKNLPPDVQADMKPRRLGLVTSVAISVVVLSIFVAGLIATGKARAMISVGFWLVLVVGSLRGVPQSQGPCLAEGTQEKCWSTSARIRSPARSDEAGGSCGWRAPRCSSSSSSISSSPVSRGPTFPRFGRCGVVRDALLVADEPDVLGPVLARQTWALLRRQALPLGRLRTRRLDRRRPSLRAAKEGPVAAPALDRPSMNGRAGSRRVT